MLQRLSRRAVAVGLAASVATPALGAATAWWDGYEQRLRRLLRTGGVFGGGTGGVFDAAMARDLFAANNRFRAEQGGQARLTWDDDLALCARAHCADMAERNFFDHMTPERFSVADRSAILCRTLLGASGENLAYRFDNRRPPTAEQFFSQWRDSEGHRVNMLRATYTHAGYGVVRHGDYVRAAGVFFGVDARLAEPLPWRVSDRRQIERLLAAASPPIARYGLSEPGVDQAYDIGPLGRRYLPLPTEVSQLRPVKALPNGRYEVLWGPIFVA